MFNICSFATSYWSAHSLFFILQRLIIQWRFLIIWLPAQLQFLQLCPFIWVKILIILLGLKLSVAEYIRARRFAWNPTNIKVVTAVWLLFSIDWHSVEKCTRAEGIRRALYCRVMLCFFFSSATPAECHTAADSSRRLQSAIIPFFASFQNRKRATIQRFFLFPCATW